MGKYRNNAAVTVATLESNYAVSKGIECVVAAHTDIFAGIVYSTALANDDVSGDASLTAPNLNA